jgi:[ribosomal protein S5]-alanine N-acetyltransferase
MQRRAHRTRRLTIRPLRLTDFKIWHQAYANLGYQIFNNFVCKGYGVESVTRAFKLAFSDLNLHRLEAAINLDNKPSLALARKCRMTYEGIRKNYLFENNRWVDHHVFSMTPEKIRKLSII